MQIFPFFITSLFFFFSEIVIGLPLRGRPILLSLVWLQTELDSTQSYYHYLYNNSEDARFFRGFTSTINHSWLTNQSARIDLVII